MWICGVELLSAISDISDILSMDFMKREDTAGQDKSKKRKDAGVRFKKTRGYNRQTLHRYSSPYLT